MMLNKSIVYFCTHLEDAMTEEQQEAYIDAIIALQNAEDCRKCTNRSMEDRCIIAARRRNNT